MRAFVTGATGFIGGRLTRALRDRGDEVVALDRRTSPLSDRSALRNAMKGCDAVFHLAAVYKVGVQRAEREQMYEANVRGTANVIDAAWDVHVPRIVHVSTVNAFGNTHGEVVDETYERPGPNFLSAYDWTKYEAHQVAKDRIERGAPVVIAQPGAVYGPGDTSQLGRQLERARRGSLRVKAFVDVGVNAVHVDDVVAGLLLIHAHGRIGESYVLGGEITRLGEMLDRVSPKPVRVTIPTAVLRALAPLGPLVGQNLRELISASDGVTYWATDAKARRELGYDPRGTLEA